MSFIDLEAARDLKADEFSSDSFYRQLKILPRKDNSIVFKGEANKFMLE